MNIVVKVRCYFFTRNLDIIIVYNSRLMEYPSWNLKTKLTTQPNNGLFFFKVFTRMPDKKTDWIIRLYWEGIRCNSYAFRTSIVYQAGHRLKHQVTIHLNCEIRMSYSVSTCNQFDKFLLQIIVFDWSFLNIPELAIGLAVITIFLMSNLLPWGLEGPWVRLEVSSLRFGGACLSSFIRSQTRFNCFVQGSVAALICLATSSDLSGALELLAALPTPSTEWLHKLWVSSLAPLVFIASVFGALIPGCKISALL